MSLKVSILASGSSGNSIWLSDGITSILIDAGISAKQLIARLEQIGETPERIEGICLTHEHKDHTKCLRSMQGKYGTKLYANSGTVDGYMIGNATALSWNVFATGQSFAIGDLMITSFPVSHDAFEPVGYIVQGGCGQCLGVVTDTGTATDIIKDHLGMCDAIIVESNHDEQALKQSARPLRTKRRVGGMRGHLSNRQASDLIVSVASVRLQFVCLVHLSRECNYPELALDETNRALRLVNHRHVRVYCYVQNHPPEIFNIRAPDEIEQNR